MTGRSQPTAPKSGGGATPVGCTTTPCPSATPLSAAVLHSVAKCPAMKADLEKLQHDGWTVVWGAPGGGYFSSRPTKVITLDPSTGTSDQNTLTMLSHEMGHAKFTPTNVTPNGLTRAQYVAAKTQADLEDEGEATLNQIRYKDCVKAGGGPDILMWYGKSAEYQAIASKYPDEKDRAKARTEIANLYGDGEHPSNCPAQTYRQYYESPCCAPACGNGAKGWAEGLSDDEWKALGGKT